MHLVLGNILIICPIQTERSLTGSCFREKGRSLAGNFCEWNTVDDVFNDDLFRAEFLEEIEMMVRNEAFNKHSVTISHDVKLGWESTDDITQFDPEELECYKPNDHSQSLRVINPNRMDRKAPLTNKVTIVYYLDLQGGKPRVTIESLYPGIDIGELEGDITGREGRVLYGWTHAGEQLTH